MKLKIQKWKRAKCQLAAELLNRKAKFESNLYFSSMHKSTIEIDDQTALTKAEGSIAVH